MFIQGGKKRKNSKTHVANDIRTSSCFFFFFFSPTVTRNVSFHKSGSKGEDNINFQFIFCLSLKWDHCGNAVRTHESEYLAV